MSLITKVSSNYTTKLFPLREMMKNVLYHQTVIHTQPARFM